LAHENLTSGAGGSDPDLIVLGFQELDLSTEALLYATSTTKEDAWAAAIFAGLGEKGILYEKVSCFHHFLCCDIMSNVCQLASKQLVGMLIIAIVKKSRLSCFSDITLSAAGAGIMGVMVGTFVNILSVAFYPYHLAGK
jgi:phosphatidylinositol-bisphosphatase